MSENLRYFLIALPITAVIVVGALVGFVGYEYSNLAPTEKEVAGEMAELKVGIPNDIMGLYPQTGSELLTMGINTSIYEGLVEFDENFRVRPLLAKSWNNPDDNTWKIYLKKGVKFHDGTTLSASDVKFTIDHLLENEYDPAEYLSSVDTVTVVDDSTIEIKTKAPYPILMNKLANVLILSEKDVTANGVDSPTGTGPYKLTEWKEGEHLKLERNESYHGEAPKAKKVTYIPIEDDEERVAKLAYGDIDIMDVFADKEVLSSLSSSKFAVRTINDYGVNILVPNYQDSALPGTDVAVNPFLDKKVRQALYYGIDLQTLVEKTGKDTSVPASQISTAAIFGYNSDIDVAKQDIDKAKGLLKEAGYENGFTTSITANPSRTPVVEELISQLSEIGITATADYLSSPREAFEKLMSGDYSLTILSWANDSGDSSDAVEGLLSTDGSNNLFGYSNAELDDLAKKAASTIDNKKRKDYLQDALKSSVDDAGYIPLTIDKHFFAHVNTLMFTSRNDGNIIAHDIAIKSSVAVEKPSFTKYLLGKVGL